MLIIAGYVAFLLMVGMVGSVRDGWQIRDLSGLTGVLLFLAAGFFAVRRLQAQWAASDLAHTKTVPGGVWIWLLGTAVLGGAAIISGMLIIGHFVREASDDSSTVNPAPTKDVVEVHVEHLPRGNWTENAFDDSAAERFRVIVQENVLRQLEAAMDQAGSTSVPQPIDLSTEAQISDFNGRRIIVVYMSSPSLLRGVTTIGVVGDNLVQVTCMSEQGRSIALDRGPCFEGLQEAYEAIR